MADIRKREQPGTVPGPRRDHETHRTARQDSTGSTHPAGDSALAWSVTAMSGALRRLAAAGDADMPQAVAAATEAVWWVTLVDAALARQHPGAYGRALAALDPAARRTVEGSLTGLRFIRSQLGHCADPGDFIQPQPASGGSVPATAWTWGAVSPPPPRRGTARDVSPYREYRAHLAGRPVAEVLGRAADFLSQAHTAAGRPAVRRGPQGDRGSGP